MAAAVSTTLSAILTTDLLRGNRDTNSLKGGVGGNDIEVGHGIDDIYGGGESVTGSNRIIRGAGSNFQYGGGGADVFVRDQVFELIRCISLSQMTDEDFVLSLAWSVRPRDA